MAGPTRAQLADRDAARAELRAILPPGSVVSVVQRHVSRSGMMRYLSLFADIDGELRNITYDAARAMGERVSDYGGHWVIRVNGCGMDMHFHTVYGLSRALYPDGAPCTGDRGCPSNDHANDYGMFAREYDAAHPEPWEGTRDEYVAARQAWVGERIAASYDPTRVHRDGGYALTKRSL